MNTALYVMMKKVIIVGLNPAKDNWKSPKKAQTIQRLEKWCNLMGVQYHSFINCIDDAGDYNQLKANFKQLEECTQGYDKVIALGNYASMCLKKINVKHFKMPHPSPRNRKLNDKDFESQIVEECRQYLES